MAENQEKTKRQLLEERMAARYPDRQFADDEELYGQIGDDYDGYEKQLGEYRDREGKLTELFDKDPRSAQFLTDMAKGTDPFIAMIERMGIDGVTDVLNDPEKKDVYAEANKKFVESLAKEKSLKEEYDQNFANSMSLLDKMQQERGISDETLDAAFDLAVKIADEVIMGKFTAETMDMVLKAITHDGDVTNARTEGTVAGRNAKIDEKLRKQNSGDGVPTLGGSNNQPTQRRNRGIFDLADDAR